MKKLALLFLAVFLGLSATAQASEGFELTVKITGYPEGEPLRLGRYHADQQYFVDSAVFDKRRNVFVFEKAERLDGGMYMLISFERTPAEFIIDQDQQFSIEMDYPFNATNVTEMKFKNSPENQTYSEFNNSIRPLFVELNAMRREFDSLPDKQSPEAERLTQNMQELWKNLEDIRSKFMLENPKHLMTISFQALREVEVPPAPDHIPENQREHWRYNYYVNHYFDNMDLTDARLLRTPVTPGMPGSIYSQRLETFLDKVLPPHPDSIKFTL